MVTVLLAPWIPGAAEKLLGAARRPRHQPRRRARSARARSARSASSTRSSRSTSDDAARRDRQPHAPGLVRAAQRRARRGGGARRASAASSRSAWTRRPAARRCRRPRTSRRCYAAVGRHPNHADGLRRRRPGRPAGAGRHARCAAIGETGLDYFRDYAPRADQERAFHAQIELARATGKPLVIHTRAAEDDTLATLARRARRRCSVILHCFSMPDRLDECLAEGWWISFAGNVTYPKAGRPGRGRRARPRRPPAGRDRRAVPHAAAGAQGAQPAGLRRPTPRASWPSAAASPTRSSSAVVERNAAALFGW